MYYVNFVVQKIRLSGYVTQKRSNSPTLARKHNPKPNGHAPPHLRQSVCRPAAHPAGRRRHPQPRALAPGLSAAFPVAPRFVRHPGKTTRLHHLVPRRAGTFCVQRPCRARPVGAGRRRRASRRPGADAVTMPEVEISVSERLFHTRTGGATAGGRRSRGDCHQRAGERPESDLFLYSFF